MAISGELIYANMQRENIIMQLKGKRRTNYKLRGILDVSVVTFAAKLFNIPTPNPPETKRQLVGILLCFLEQFFVTHFVNFSFCSFLACLLLWLDKKLRNDCVGNHSRFWLIFDESHVQIWRLLFIVLPVIYCILSQQSVAKKLVDCNKLSRRCGMRSISLNIPQTWGRESKVAAVLQSY